MDRCNLLPGQKFAMGRPSWNGPWPMTNSRADRKSDSPWPMTKPITGQKSDDRWPTVNSWPGYITECSNSRTLCKTSCAKQMCNRHPAITWSITIGVLERVLENAPRFGDDFVLHKCVNMKTLVGAKPAAQVRKKLRYIIDPGV